MENNGEANQITYNILDLPRELLHAILELIQKEEDRSCVRLVSRLLFDLIGRSHFDLGLIMPSEIEQLVRVFGRYQKQIGLALNNTQKLENEDIKRLSVLTQLTSLSLNGNIDSSVLTNLSNLVSLGDESTVVATSTLQHLSNLTRLQVEVIGNASEKAILTNLESLDLTNMENSWSNIICPKVTSLTLRSNTIPPKKWLAQFKPRNITLQSLSRALRYQLPSGSCQHLTSLSIEGITIDNKSEVLWHQLRELRLKFTMKTIDMSILWHVSKCTSLTTLDIKSPMNQATLDAIDVREMKHLQSFTMYLRGPLFGTVKNVIPQLNKDSLKTLSLSIHKDHEESFVEISKMTKLEDLQLRILKASVDLSSLMTMTQLTSLKLNPGQYLGLENLTRMTNLNAVKIISN